MWVTGLDYVADIGHVMSMSTKEIEMTTKQGTKQVEVQLLKIGREHPTWSINVKVDGRSVERVSFPSKRAAFAANADIANKYR
jgi:hypothetical protein